MTVSAVCRIDRGVPAWGDSAVPCLGPMRADFIRDFEAGNSPSRTARWRARIARAVIAGSPRYTGDARPRDWGCRYGDPGA